MRNTNSEIISILNKLKRYQNVGYMDGFEIGEIIEDIKRAYSDENQYRLKVMMEEVTAYMTCLSDNNLLFEEYVKSNISKIARLLEKSERTIYRKLQNNSFSLIEKQMITKEMDNDKEV